MVCDDTLCLDKKEKTKIIFGSSTMKLDEFDDMIENDSNMKEKMREIDEKLKNY